MRTLLLILLFGVWESATETPLPLVDPVLGAMLLLIGYGVLIVVMRLWGGRVARRGAHRRLGRRVDRFNLAMGFARGLIPAWFAIGVFAMGWRRLVDDTVVHVLGGWAGKPLVTPGVLVGLLPGLFGWMALWWAQYPVDRVVREQSVLAHLEADLPVFTPPPFAGYFANKVRMQLLFTTVPVLLVLMLRDGATLALRAAGRAGRFHLTWPAPPSVDACIDVATIAVVLIVIPAVQRHVLSTRRLPDGRLRDGLADVLGLAGVRCREVLLWDTHNNVGNAAVMGVVPMVRYVMLSDLLLETMTDEQVQAVFAHELGHVHHRHLAWFAGVIGSAIAALSVGGDWLVDRLHPTTTAAAAAMDGGTVVAMVAIVWIGYGLLSRWFERQADVYAVRLMQQISPDGAAAFTSALRRVAVVNNIPFAARNWTHGSMAARVAYLTRLADPTVGQRFDRRSGQVRLGLWILVIACVAVAAISFVTGTATPN